MTPRLRLVLGRIAEACSAVDRSPDEVRLLAVSKMQPVDKIRELAQAGVRDFGENYLQDALEKMRALADAHLVWHFIGRLQSNKAGQVAQHFDWVHSLDSLKLAERLSRLRPDTAEPLNVCVQVNPEAESGKGGVSPQALYPLLEQVAVLPRLRLRGLMCIPSADAQVAVYEQMRGLTAKAPMPLDTLSMGMSADMERAIAAGSTCVRVGTALFGERG